MLHSDSPISDEDFRAFGLVVEAVNTERLEQLADATEAALPGAPALEAVIDAMIMPLAKRTVGVDNESLWAVRCVQAFFVLSEELRSQIYESQMKTVYTAFVDALQHCLPEMPGAEIRARLFIATGALLGAIARLDMVTILEKGQRSEAAMWGMIHSMRDGLCGLFRAPVRVGMNESIFIDESKKNRLVSMNDITWIASSGNYTRVYFRGGGHADALRTLANWRRSLPRGKFLSTRRGCLVNRAAIEAAKWIGHHRLELRLYGQIEPHVCSRRQSSPVAKELEIQWGN